jgi:sugar phosphate isomerase/epimerase
VSPPWRLAIHGAMLHALPAREAVSLISAKGYQGLFWQLDPGSIEQLSSLPALNGQSLIACTGVSFAPDDRNPVAPARAVEIARAVGAPHLRVCGAPMTGHTYVAAYDATVRLCEAYISAARKHALRVLLHQRWGTVTASASQVQRVLANFDPRDVGCIYDAGSMTIEGYEEYRIGLEILGSYVADVHIANTRDFPSASRTVWEWEWSPLSDGLIDLRRLFRALRRAGYQGWVTLADRCQGRSTAELLDVDRHILLQAMDDFEGIGSHNPLRPLDDHVDLAERPERTLAELTSAVGAHP